MSYDRTVALMHKMLNVIQDWAYEIHAIEQENKTKGEKPMYPELTIIKALGNRGFLKENPEFLDLLAACLHFMEHKTNNSTDEVLYDDLKEIMKKTQNLMKIDQS